MANYHRQGGSNGPQGGPSEQNNHASGVQAVENA